MSCLLAKSDAASLTQAFCRGPIKHRVGRSERRSRLRNFPLDCASSGGQCSRTRVGRTGGKELVSTLPYWVPRAIGSHMLATMRAYTDRRVDDSRSRLFFRKQVHTSFSHGVPVSMCYVHGVKRGRVSVRRSRKMEDSSGHRAGHVDGAGPAGLRQHLRSTTCSAVTASLRA